MSAIASRTSAALPLPPLYIAGHDGEQRMGFRAGQGVRVPPAVGAAVLELREQVPPLEGELPVGDRDARRSRTDGPRRVDPRPVERSEEHTSELQSRFD